MSYQSVNTAQVWKIRITCLTLSLSSSFKGSHLLILSCWNEECCFHLCVCLKSIGVPYWHHIKKSIINYIRGARSKQGHLKSPSSPRLSSAKPFWKRSCCFLSLSSLFTLISFVSKLILIAFELRYYKLSIIHLDLKENNLNIVTRWAEGKLMVSLFALI